MKCHVTALAGAGSIGCGWGLASVWWSAQHPPWAPSFFSPGPAVGANVGLWGEFQRIGAGSSFRSADSLAHGLAHSRQACGLGACAAGCCGCSHRQAWDAHPHAPRLTPLQQRGEAKVEGTRYAVLPAIPRHTVVQALESPSTIVFGRTSCLQRHLAVRWPAASSGPPLRRPCCLQHLDQRTRC
jgi:hypothetical protein